MKVKVRVVHEVTLDLPSHVQDFGGILTAKFSGTNLREQAPFPRELMDHGLHLAIKEAYATGMAYARNSTVVGDAQLVSAGVGFSGETYVFEVLSALS
jgi:hypothetical protein